MADIGAEVGQKMRSAIKAKLMELDCYVDDELPDYIMVMVANKRTKSQMNEDLQLFLTAKTGIFVDWLHIVLKKLKEVHVTNPEVYKKTLKRKPEDASTANIKVKKEKRDKKITKKQKDSEIDIEKSLTDDLPITANKLSEVRKIIVMQGNNNNTSNNISDDSFDIPLLSEVGLSNEKELEVLEKRIKSVKTRLGIQVDSESEDEDFINIKAEPDELFPSEKNLDRKSRKIVLEKDSSQENEENFDKITDETENNFAKQFRHARITFDNGSTKKTSVLDRLGRKAGSSNEINTQWRESVEKSIEEESSSKNFTNNNKYRRGPFIQDLNKKKDKILQFEKPRESVLSRLGIISKVAIPDKRKETPSIIEEEEEDEPILKDVPSVVKVKPRILPPNAKQANKTLLLKAVADAQRSIAQTPKVGSTKPEALYTKKYHEKVQVSPNKIMKRKILDIEKSKLKNIMVHIAKEEKKTDNNETTPPLRKAILNETHPSLQVKSTENVEYKSAPVVSHKFIVTLDGVDKHKLSKTIKTRKTPSPIIFDKIDATIKNKPDLLPKISSVQLKNKERCKYWPMCKQGEKCEFIHPNTTCKMFPSCKFGDKCLYIHPPCKFEASCTKRDCPYSHSSTSKIVASRIVPPTTSIHVAKQTLQTCKYFPQCNNLHCTFYHPKPCKFGIFCKNQAECNFSHTYIPKNSNLTWRSDKI